MNSNDFFAYIRDKIDEEFAFFFCKELRIVSPSVLIALSTKQMEEITRSVYPDIVKSSSVFYNSNHELKSTVMVLIELLKTEFIQIQRKKRKRIFWI